MSNEKVFQMKLQSLPTSGGQGGEKGPFPGEVDAAAAGSPGTARSSWPPCRKVTSPRGFLPPGASAPSQPGPITGSVCGVKVEAIQDPLLREIRYLDKLVDELAKGKPLEKVLRQG